MLAHHYKADDIRIHDMIFTIIQVLRTKRVIDAISRVDVTVLIIHVVHFYCDKMESKLVSATRAAWAEHMKSGLPIDAEVVADPLVCVHAPKLLGNLVGLLVDLVSGWNLEDNNRHRVNKHKDMHFEALLRYVVELDMKDVEEQRKAFAFSPMVEEEPWAIPFAEVLTRLHQWSDKNPVPVVDEVSTLKSGLATLQNQLRDFDNHQKRTIAIRFSQFAWKHGAETTDAVYRLLCTVALFPIKAPVDVFTALQGHAQDAQRMLEGGADLARQNATLA